MDDWHCGPRASWKTETVTQLYEDNPTRLYKFSHQILFFIHFGRRDASEAFWQPLQACSMGSEGTPTMSSKNTMTSLALTLER